jgi:hypothetical protein
MDKDLYRPAEGSVPDGMHTPACRDETCSASAPGMSDPGRFAELAASWWAQLLPERQASWIGRLRGSLVSDRDHQRLAYRTGLQDRRACELHLVSYRRARRLPDSAHGHEQQVRDIDSLLALEHKGAMREADVAAGIAWWNDLTAGEKTAWLIVSGGETAADAWAYRCRHPLSNLQVLGHLGQLITGTRSKQT